MDTSAERNIVAYIDWITDPQSFVDEELVGKLDQQIAEATNVMDKLRLLKERHFAVSVDGERLRFGFVNAVYDWAVAEDIPASAFLEMGVPVSALAEAGLIEGPRGRLAPPPARQRRMTKFNRTLVPDQIRDYLVTNGTGTIRQISEAHDYSVALAKKVIDEMIADGIVEEIGVTSAHRGRGAKVYAASRGGQ